MENRIALFQFTHKRALGSVYTVYELDDVDREFLSCYPVPEGWEFGRVTTKRMEQAGLFPLILVKKDWRDGYKTHVKFIETGRDDEQVWLQPQTTVRVITIF
jgi:hypothetical protein